jgi:hypothetical protein
MSDSLEGLHQGLTLWTNIAHKLWEARAKLLPKTEEHTQDVGPERTVFTPEILAVYDGLDALYMEAEQKKREILERIARLQATM